MANTTRKQISTIWVMFMNKIAINQNLKENLGKRLACKELYSCAKKKVYLQFALAVIVGIMYIIYTFSNPIFSFLHCTINEHWFFPFITPITSILFTLVDNSMISSSIKSKVEQAAYIQEDFDRTVLELPPNKMIVPSFEYVIYVIKTDKLSEFLDWYDVNISNIPIEFGRIIAQKSNCIWEINLKNDFKNTLGVILIILFILLIIMLIHTYDVKSFIVGIISTLYIINLFLKYHKAQDSSKNNINELNSKIDELWESIIESKETSNLIESSRDIQTQLFYHRLHVALVPDIFYNIRKTEHQDITKIHIEKMINEYINNFEQDNNNNNGF